MNVIIREDGQHFGEQSKNVVPCVLVGYLIWVDLHKFCILEKLQNLHKYSTPTHIRQSMIVDFTIVIEAIAQELGVAGAPAAGVTWKFQNEDEVL